MLPLMPALIGDSIYGLGNTSFHVCIILRCVQGLRYCLDIDHILILSTLLECVVSCRVCEDTPLNTSDYRPVVCHLQLDNVVKNVHPGKIKRSKRWDKWNQDERFEKYTIPVTTRLMEISKLLQMCDATPSNIDIILNLVTDTLKSDASAVPTSKFRPHLRPYWNETLTLLKIDKVKKYRKWKESGRPRVTPYCGRKISVLKRL